MASVHRDEVNNFNTRFASWNAGPEFANAALIVLVDRRNKRASVKNRKDFPNIGHYEHDFIDKLVVIYNDLFKEQRYQWWSLIQTNPVLNETFGITPTLPKSHQEKVTENDTSNYPPSMKFLATRRNEKVPTVGISTKQEKLLYIQSVTSYIKDSGLDADSFAHDWNFGKLKQFGGAQRSVIPTGSNHIWKKLPFHLDSYYKIYLKARERREMVSRLPNELPHTKLIDIDFLDAAESEPIPMVYFEINSPDVPDELQELQQIIEVPSTEMHSIENHIDTSLSASVSLASADIGLVKPPSLLLNSRNVLESACKPSKAYKTCQSCLVEMKRKGWNEKEGKIFINPVKNIFQNLKGDSCKGAYGNRFCKSNCSGFGSTYPPKIAQ